MKKDNLTEEERLKKKKIRKLRKTLSSSKNKRIFLFSLLAIVLMVVIIIVTWDRYEEMTEFKVENYQLYQYFGGIRFDYTGEFSIKQTGEIVNLKYKDIKIDSDSSPIYFANEDNKMMIPQSMGLYIPRYISKSYKLPYFSKIVAKNTNGTTSVYVEQKKKNMYLEESFMYDGNDLYVALYPTDVVVKGKKITLSPLSYISVSYHGDVYYYDKEKDKYQTIEDVQTDVVATLGEYKINLSTDMIIYQNSNKLLIKNVNGLPTYEK